jgi:hypothetical protein
MLASVSGDVLYPIQVSLEKEDSLP